MAKFPIDYGDPVGIVDAVNYVLSGPDGTGQNIDGFSANGGDLQSDLTGNARPPFTQVSFNDPHVPGVYITVAPIALSTAEMLDSRTWKYTFSVAQALPPFIPGQPITASGVADAVYNQTFTPIGVVECTVDYVIARSFDAVAVVADSTGGTVELVAMERIIPTDCNAYATVTGNTDRVFITAQLNNEIFRDTGPTGSYYYRVYINRYVSVPSTSVLNPGFEFVFEKTIAFKEYLIASAGAPFSEERETIFTSVIDAPGAGYYWYIMEIQFSDNSGGNIITSCIFTQRSFSAQVVKE